MKELEKSAFESGKSDLSLVLGTSLRVSPANKFPLQAIENGGKMVIVNLQVKFLEIGLKFFRKLPTIKKRSWSFTKGPIK
jgi:NAD-dependent SIR2 family protein deacetylase